MMHVKPFLTGLAALALLGAPLSIAHAAAHEEPSPEAADPANFAANWAVDESASHIKFSALQKGAKFTGEFEEFDVKVDFDPTAPQDACLSVAIVMKSADANDAERNESLPTDNWFGVSEYPLASYQSQGFEPINVDDDGSGTYATTGKLTLRDTTKPFRMEFDLQLDGDTAIVTAMPSLDRGDFNIGQGVWATDEWVSLNVDLDIKITATRR